MKSKKGIALITVLLVMVALFLVTTGLATMAVNSYKSTLELENATTTLYLANAGVEYAYFLVNHDWTVERTWNNNDNATACTNLDLEHTCVDFLGTEYVLAPSLVGSGYLNGSYFGTFTVAGLEPLDSSMNPTTNPGNVQYLRVKSIGRIRSGPVNVGAIQSDPVVAQRTVFAVLHLTTAPFNNCTGSPPCADIKKDIWYEKYR